MNGFEQKIGYTFQNRAYLERALTHSSYVNGKQHSNERLEFLGDSVLSVVVSKYLFEMLDMPEGRLTKIRAKLVCEEEAERSLGISYVDRKKHVISSFSCKTVGWYGATVPLRHCME